MTDEEILQILNDADEAHKWMIRNYEEIRKNNINKYVAVDEHGVIASNDDFDVLLNYLEKENKDLNRIIIKYVPENNFEMIL
jgi:hypothetical protein